jgi:hypothetical protein
MALGEHAQLCEASEPADVRPVDPHDRPRSQIIRC